jgi:hypothetical protein
MPDKVIEPTDKTCNLCGSQMGVIHGVLSDTYYCRNYNCYSLPYSEINDKGKEFTKDA